MGTVSGMRFVILIQEDKKMSKKVRNIVLVAVGMLAVTGFIFAVVTKKRTEK